MLMNFLYIKGTGASHILRQTTVRVADNKACGADSENMLCAGKFKFSLFKK